MLRPRPPQQASDTNTPSSAGSTDGSSSNAGASAAAAGSADEDGEASPQRTMLQADGGDGARAKRWRPSILTTAALALARSHHPHATQTAAVEEATRRAARTAAGRMGQAGGALLRLKGAWTAEVGSLRIRFVRTAVDALAPSVGGRQARVGPQARVPSVPSPLCSCDGGRQTAKHVLIFCPRHSGARHELRDEQGHLPNFSKLLGTAEGLRKTTKWVMQREILGQFRGARDLLYGSPFSLSRALD